MIFRLAINIATGIRTIWGRFVGPGTVQDEASKVEMPDSGCASISSESATDSVKMTSVESLNTVNIYEAMERYDLMEKVNYLEKKIETLQSERDELKGLLEPKKEDDDMKATTKPGPKGKKIPFRLASKIASAKCDRYPFLAPTQKYTTESVDSIRMGQRATDTLNQLEATLQTIRDIIKRPL